MGERDPVRSIEELNARLAELEAELARERGEKATARAAGGQLQGILDSMPLFVFWKNRDSVYQGCNRRFAAVAGIEKTGDIVGKTDYDLPWKASEADFFRECDRRVMNHDRPETNIIEPQLQSDGKQAWLDTNKFPLHDESGRVVGILGMYEDITERKLAEDAMAASEENLRITLNSIGDAVIATDARGRITRINPVAEQLTGWNAEDAEGRELSEVFQIVRSDTREPLTSPVSRVLETGKIVGLETDTILLAKDGRQRQIADSGAPIRNRFGKIVGVVLVFRDVTAQHEIESQLRQSQKMESIGQLAGGVAHDFNNVLTAIVGATEVVLAREALSPDSLENLRLVLKSAERAGDLTDKLLAFSRKGKIGRSPVDLHRCITEAVQLLESSIDKRIEVKIRTGAQHDVVMGEADQLQHAILNLGLNARDAIEGSGRIVISTANVDLTDTATPGTYIEVDVRDDGRGIPPDVIDQVFEPFFTTKEVGRGTGLGLSAVYGAALRHGGFVQVVSEVGRGSVFKLFLPVYVGAEVDPEHPRVEGSRRGAGCVLVVDDEAIVRTVVRSHLERFGCKVLSAEDGEQAVELYRKLGDRIDVVILDMVMPRKSGRETFEDLQRLDPDVQVMFCSGFSQDDRIDELLDRGALGFLKKPYTYTQLTEELAKYLPTRVE